MSGLIAVSDLLVPLLVKSSLVIALAALVSLAVGRAAAATRHRVWAAAFAALVLLPILSVALPGLELAWLPTVDGVERSQAGRFDWGERGALELQGAELDQADLQAAELGVAGPESADREGSAPIAAARSFTASLRGVFPPASAGALGAAYLVGVAALLAWLILGVALVRRWAARGEVVTGEASWSAALEPLTTGVGRRIELVITPQVRVPMVWMPLFARRATVLLPEAARSWTPAQRRDTLVHELAHVERLDGPVQLAARLVSIAYWFHPLAWLALARLRLEAERACDDRVLATGSASCDYAERLVTLARGAARLRPRVAATQATVALSGRQQLARRVHALLDAGRRRVPAGPLATALLAAAVLVPALALAPVRLVEAEVSNPWAGPTVVNTASESYPDARAKADVGDAQSGTALTAPAGRTASSGRTAPTGRTEPISRTHRARAAGIFDPSGLTPLMAAVVRGDGGLVDELVAAGADPDRAVASRGTPLILAAAAGDAAMVRRLLGHGADPNRLETGRPRPDDLPRSPLGAAARSGNADTVDALLAAGAEVDVLPRGDATPLMIAARHGNLGVARRLVTAGADIDAIVKGDGTPLIEAVRGGHPGIVDLLLSEGADPALGVAYDGNPLIWAVRDGDHELAGRLLAAGADPNAWVEGDESAFFHAVESRDGEMVRLLLDAGADPDVDPDLGDFDVDFDDDSDPEVHDDVRHLRSQGAGE